MYFLNLQILTLLLVIRATNFVPTSYRVHLCCLNSLTANCTLSGAYQVALVVKNRPANVGDIRDVVWSLGQLDPLKEGMAIHSSNLAWRIPWTEEPGGSTGLQSQTPPKGLSTHAYLFWLEPIFNKTQKMMHLNIDSYHVAFFFMFFLNF